MSRILLLVGEIVVKINSISTHVGMKGFLPSFLLLLSLSLPTPASPSLGK